MLSPLGHEPMKWKMILDSLWQCIHSSCIFKTQNIISERCTFFFLYTPCLKFIPQECGTCRPVIGIYRNSSHPRGWKCTCSSLSWFFPLGKYIFCMVVVSCYKQVVTCFCPVEGSPNISMAFVFSLFSALLGGLPHLLSFIVPNCISCACSTYCFVLPLHE